MREAVKVSIASEPLKTEPLHSVIGVHIVRQYVSDLLVPAGCGYGIVLYEQYVITLMISILAMIIRIILTISPPRLETMSLYNGPDT